MIFFGKVKAINTITKSVWSVIRDTGPQIKINYKGSAGYSFIYFWFGNIPYNNGMMKNQHYVLSKLKELYGTEVNFSIC